MSKRTSEIKFAKVVERVLAPMDLPPLDWVTQRRGLIDFHRDAHATENGMSRNLTSVQRGPHDDTLGDQRVNIAADVHNGQGPHSH